MSLLWALILGALLALAGGAAVWYERRRRRLLADELVRAQRDLEQERRHGRALDEAHRRAAGIVEALGDPLLGVGRDRRVRFANPEAVALLAGRPVGRDLADSLRDPSILEAVERVLTTGVTLTVELSRPMPVERVFTVRLTPLALSGTAPDAKPDGALLSFHDITAMKRIEQMRADFVANASHELRTPLTGLMGFIETLRGPARDDPAAQARFLGIMEDQAGRMSRLISDLLSLSRIEQDEHLAPTGHVDLEKLLRTVCDALQVRAAARGVQLLLEVEGRLPILPGDADQLMQVFQNLVDNAIKYGAPSSPVTIAASARTTPGPAVAVRVTDRGEGIAREHLPRLTERFYRVDAARSRAVGGTGLGLAIVKHIVNRHRGTLSIESEPGTGSTFTVTLPVRPAAQAGDKKI